ncbi:conserved repeat domain-containing protein, partial [Lysobacter sp. yr284]
MWFAAALALAGLPAFAQNFPTTLSNTATIAPPNNVTNVDTQCTRNGGVFDPGTGRCSATDNNTLAAVADLVLTKTNGGNGVTAGGTTVYTVVLTNNGPSAANGTVIRDPAAAGLSKTSVTCLATGNAVCPAVTVANFESGLTIATLPSGGTLTFTVNANVTATSGSVSNSVTATLPPNTTDPTPTGTVTDTDPVIPVADLTLTKSNGVNTVKAGDPTTYTIELSNAGPSAADGSVVRDPAAAGLNKTSVTCLASGAAVCPTVT